MNRVYDYNGQHSVTFTNVNGISRNTWTDWGLIPASRHSEPINSIWSNSVTVAGLNGTDDLVRSHPFSSVNSYKNLKSAVKNDNRDYIFNTDSYDIFQPMSGSLSFVIADQEESFFAKRQKILKFLHNQNMIMTFSDDPNRKYSVRTTVESFNSGGTFSSMSISYSILHEEVSADD